MFTDKDTHKALKVCVETSAAPLVQEVDEKKSAIDVQPILVPVVNQRSSFGNTHDKSVHQESRLQDWISRYCVPPTPIAASIIPGCAPLVLTQPFEVLIINQGNLTLG